MKAYVVDSAAVRSNLQILKDRAGSAVLWAVLKGDGYGLGLVQMAAICREAGVTHFAVTEVSEVSRLRAGGFQDCDILMLRPTADAGELTQLLNLGAILTVSSQNDAAVLNGVAEKLGMQAQVHIKIDTGMNRIGVRTEEELSAVLDVAAKCPHVRITGALTHFATADVPESDFGGEQIARFERMTALMRARGLNFERHAAASAAAVRYPQARYDRVRAGIVMYGIDPLGQLDVRPALRWTTRVSYVKTIESGDTVSYGRRFTAARPTRIATLPVGYADGYRRSFSNRAQVLLHGRRVPVVGSVCMDQVMVDATGLDVQMGDEAVLLGRQGEEEISCCELAQLDGTIPYEIMTGISARVPRVYEQQ